MIIKKEIENIFEQKTKKETKPKEKIIIDYREKNSFVPSILIGENFDIEFKELKVADYIVKDVAIERKTVNDFTASMTNKHLINQLIELNDYPKKLLIIEGVEEQELYSENSRINPNAIRGFLLSIVLKYNIPIIYTKNAKDTAKFISVLAKKQGTEMSLIQKKKPKTIKEQLQFIIEGFPGIGPKTAKKILEHFGSIKNLTNAQLKELEKILGKKAEIFYKILNQKY